MATLRPGTLPASILATAVTFLAAGAARLPAQDARFIRGDGNGDGAVDLADGVYTLSFLFLGSPAALPCKDAADVNDDGALDLTDTVYLLEFLFVGGPPPAPPFPFCGPDPTTDALGCVSYSACPPTGSVGRIVAELLSPFDDGQFAALTPQDRLQLQAEGIVISDAAKTLRSPRISLAGYWVEIAGERYMIGRNGRFEVQPIAGGGGLADVPVFADQGDVEPVGTIADLQLGPPGADPPPTSVLQVVTPPPENEMNDEPPPGGGAVCPTRDVRSCAPGANASACCLDYDNPAGDHVAYQRKKVALECQEKAVYNWVLSTCFLWSFLKPSRACLFESAYPWGSRFPNCFNRHKYRNCQNLDEDDFALTPGDATIKTGESVALILRNNTPANCTQLIIDGPAGGTIRLVSPPGPTLKTISKNCYILQHYSDRAKMHYETVTIEFVAPKTVPSGCSAVYTVEASGGGRTARTDVTVNSGAGGDQCWVGSITFSMKAKKSDSSTCDGGSGTHEVTYDYHGTVTVTSVLSTFSNGGFTILTLAARSHADATYVLSDRSQCHHHNSSCEWDEVDTRKDDLSGSAEEKPVIVAQVNPDGSYFLSAEFPLVEMSGDSSLATAVTIITKGCTGDGSTGTSPLSLAANLTDVPMKGTVSPVDVKKISGSFQGPGDYVGIPGTIDVKWELTRN